MSKVKALIDGFVGHGGVPVLLAVDEEYESDHPLVVARPDLFTAPPSKRAERAEPEQKRAEPEQKRTILGRPKSEGHG